MINLRTKIHGNHGTHTNDLVIYTTIIITVTLSAMAVVLFHHDGAVQLLSN